MKCTVVISLKFFFLLFAGAMLALSSCSNPVTPEVKKTVIDAPQPVTVPLTSIQVEAIQGDDYIPDSTKRKTMGFPPGSATNKRLFSCMVDTSKNVPVLSLRAELIPSNSNILNKEYPLQNVILRLNLPVDGNKKVELDTSQLRVVMINKSAKLDTVGIRNTPPQSWVTLDQHKSTAEKVLHLTLTLRTPTQIPNQSFAFLRATFRIPY